jgi:hypothetical protein
MLFQGIIALYSENHTDLKNTLHENNAELLVIIAGGTHSYRWVLKYYGNKRKMIVYMFRLFKQSEIQTGALPNEVNCWVKMGKCTKNVMNTIHEINCFEQCKSCSAPSLFFTKMFLV